VKLPGLDGRVVIVTGANHGIGAATAEELARHGAAVLISYFRLPPSEPDAERPQAYDRDRGRDATAVVEAIRDAGGRADAIEADLTDPATPPALFDAAEAAFGPVDVLVHNASGWRKDSFGPSGRDTLGRPTHEVTAQSADGQFLVDARAGGLLIMELARRHRARRATSGRIVTLTSGGPGGFVGEASYGAAKAALENYTMTAAQELGRGASPPTSCTRRPPTPAGSRPRSPSSSGTSTTSSAESASRRTWPGSSRGCARTSGATSP
jgi:3-oxoacyl-[acyl-carrier protein] reductase